MEQLHWSEDRPEIKRAVESMRLPEGKGINIIDPSGKIIAGNDRATSILKTPAGTGLDDPRWQAISPDGKLLGVEDYPASKTLTSGENESGFVMGIATNKEGTAGLETVRTTWITIDSWAVRNEAGQVIAVMTIFEDITDTPSGHLASEALANAYRILAEDLQELIYLVDPQGSITWASPSVYTFTGLVPAQILGQPSLNLIHPDDVEKACKVQAAGNNEPAFGQVRWRHRAGGWRWVEGSTHPVRTTDGQLIGRKTIIRDIHEVKQAQESQQNLQKRYDHLFAAHQAPMILVEAASGTILEANQAAANLLGAGQLTGRTLQKLLNLPQGWNDGEHTWDTSWTDSEAKSREGQIHLMPVGADGQELLLASIWDLSARAEYEQALRLTSAVFDSAGEGLMILDEQGIIVKVNRAFTALTGWTEDQLVGHKHSELAVGSAINSEQAELGNILKQQGTGFRAEMSVPRADGTILPALASATAYYDDKGQVKGYIGVLTDLSEIQAAREHLEYKASHDEVTGLPNRRWMSEQVAQTIANLQPGHCAALVMIDIDRLKRVNDSYGRSAGNALIKKVAERIKDRTKEGCSPKGKAASFGADEFAILVREAPDLETIREKAACLAELLNQAYELEAGVRVHITVGMSIVMMDSESDPHTILREADATMHLAKRKGSGQILGQEAGAATYVFDLELETELREAVMTAGIEAHYQAQIHLADNQVVGFEALARWQRVNGEQVSPVVFIPVAEECGIMDELGSHILRTAATRCSVWNRNLGQKLTAAVNVSAQQLEREGFINEVDRVLTITGLNPEQLELEITESILLAAGSVAEERLRQLKALGVRIAIDDFGTGYSSFAYLRNFPIDTLKIDREFIQALGESERDNAIVKAIIAMGKALGCEILAEGVETIQQATWLKDAGCDYYQGYLASRPLNEQDFETYLKSQ